MASPINDPNSDLHTYASFGRSLIKEVTITVGGVVVAHQRACKKCGELFNCADGDDWLMLMRELSGNDGDVELCCACDHVKFHSVEA